jgi:hypothetical protein
MIIDLEYGGIGIMTMYGSFKNQHPDKHDNDQVFSGRPKQIKVYPIGYKQGDFNFGQWQTYNMSFIGQ